MDATDFTPQDLAQLRWDLCSGYGSARGSTELDIPPDELSLLKSSPEWLALGVAHPPTGDGPARADAFQEPHWWAWAPLEEGRCITDDYGNQCQIDGPDQLLTDDYGDAVVKK